MYPPPPPPPPISDPNMVESNGGQYPGKKTPCSLIVFLNIVNTLTHLLLGAVAFSAFFYAQAFSVRSAFTDHIFLCITGYVILMSEAILCMNPNAGWAQNLKYPHKKMIHAAMQIIGATLAIIGSVIMIVEMNQYNMNFNTAHGITGLIAMVLTILSLIGGCLNFIMSNKPTALLFKIAHSCFSSVTITVAFVTVCLGFTDTYRMNFGDTNANLSITYTLFALLGILISTAFQIFKRIAG